MSWKTILQFSHIFCAVSLIILVMLQTPENGLSGIFGSGGENYHTRRGAEKTIFFLTIFLGIIFSTTSILNFLFN